MQFNALLFAALAGASAMAQHDIRDLDPLPEFTPDGVPIIDLRGPLSERANCQNAPGVANGECVQYFSDFGCGSQNRKAQYKPTCAGNCYVDSFDSLSVAGDGTYGTDCVVYSDNQCQNKVGDTGNHVVGQASCLSVAGNSMKCYYRC